MNKESVNNDIRGAVIVKRSPSFSVKSSAVAGQSSGAWIKRDAATGKLRNSMNKNINTLGRWLKESEQIMPRPQR
jgi:uncharacterized protein YfiM (DUF2279 family)